MGADRVRQLLRWALGGPKKLGGYLVKSSTWETVRASGWRRLLTGQTLHGYFYARWPRLYVYLGARKIVPILSGRGKRHLADHYHGKVLPVELARSIVTVKQDIPLRDLEHIIPYPTARDLVLRASPDIAVLDCACRRSSPDPCTPSQVCMVVGQPIVNFTLDHHPKTSRRLSTQEAVELLEQEHARGHVHTAYFKDAALDRFFVICNCCSCCCGAIAAMTRYDVPMIAASGYLVQVSANRCSGCGRCVEVCAFGALSIETKTVQVDAERCMGCGACTSACARQALSLERDPRKGEPLDIEEIIARDNGASAAQPGGPVRHIPQTMPEPRREVDEQAAGD